MALLQRSSHNFEGHPPQNEISGRLFPTNGYTSCLPIRNVMASETTNGGQDDPNTREIQYHSSSSGEFEDPVLVQPSFDDQGPTDGANSPDSSLDKSRERQSRSPDGDSKGEDSETRNPSSPDRERKQERRGSHTRNLSALFEATTISDVMNGPEQMVGLDSEPGRKHRRVFSNDVTNPNFAHRRLDSGGQLAPVSRRHHRENSGGLDILSLAATKEEPADVIESGRENLWDQHNPRPRTSLGQVSSSSSSSYSRGLPPPSPYRSHPIQDPPQHLHMEPPPQRFPGHYPPHHAPHHPPHHLPYVHHYPLTHGPNAYHHFPPPVPPSGVAYYGQYPNNGPVSHYPPPYSQRLPDYYKGNEYSRSRPPHEMETNHFERDSYAPRHEWETPHRLSTSAESGPSSNHQGVQTSITSISPGGNEHVVPSRNLKNAGTNTEIDHPPIPAEVGHHRKMSSYSSLGTLLGSSLFPNQSGSGGSDEEAQKSQKYHRSTSSSVSFLNGFVEVGLSDDNFLRNLQAANASATSTFRSSPPPDDPLAVSTFRSSPPPGDHQIGDSTFRDSPPDSMLGSTLAKPLDPFPESDSSDTEDHIPTTPHSSGMLKLAEGGTSKRVRRKCTTPGCANRVVQGGLCISHGAKRKTCKHPGCNKNVKKAGLCSAHGPARKRCEERDCGKVAVQGGRCIAHGAKKKMCLVEGCTKQAILSGMCKKHHDQEQLKKNFVGGEFCKPTSSHKPTHTRGLSIFQEMSADAVSSLLHDAKESDAFKDV